MVLYLIGAGPGDIELMTLKGKRLIQNADVLIYDKLANPEMLNWAKSNCKIIYVGKRESNSHDSQNIQKNINELIHEFGRSKKVVRLKGGDSFIFGRGGEEAQICARERIHFEVIPGISSFYAVPAYAGIPVTHRDFNSSFAVVTGHESVKAKSSIKWKELPETIIILMGVSAIQSIAQKLIDAGREPSTPVAAIYKGTTLKQKTTITNLQRILNEGIPFKPPVIFIVGKVAYLHEELNWFENKIKNVDSRNVVLLGAKGHENDNINLIKSYGIDVEFIPLLEIMPREFILPDIGEYDALVFTSVEGIKQVELKINLIGYKGKIFAIGPKTKKYLAEKLNISASIGSVFNSEGLAEYILNNLERCSKILTLRSSSSTTVLFEKLTKKFEVNEIYVYDIKSLHCDDNKIERIKRAEALFVSSATCAKGIHKLDEEILKKKIFVAIGPETSRHIHLPHITASTHTIQGMIDAYIDSLWE
ncbi:MAG: uroporphyrinogen-III C-methyltransferase [Promethearchaeota archaeon]